MLYLDEYGKVNVDSNMVNTTIVSDLYKQDTSKNKTDFTKWITYTYHLYKKDHVLNNFGPQERKQRVLSMYFFSDDISLIETMPAFIEFKKLYLDTQFTPTGRFIENLKKDMEEMLEHIRLIPLVKETLVDVEVPTKTGVRKEKKLMTVDNSEEKFSALKRAADLINLYDKFNERLKTEQREEKRKGGTRRIFDERDKI